MRKAYSKPQILFEDFTVSTSIATGCKETGANSAYLTCGFDFPGIGSVFTTALTAVCTGFAVPDNGDKDGVWNELCYHVPDGDNALFTS